MPLFEQPNVATWALPGPIQSEQGLARRFRAQRRAFTSLSWHKYNFVRFAGRKGTYHRSQSNQSEAVDELVAQLRNGFFVESGSFDSEQLSNSLFFEQARSWTGLLVEANPRLFAIGKLKNRRCYRINAALSISSTPTAMPFTMLGSLGGFQATQKNKGNYMKSNPEVSRDQGEVIDVPTYSLSRLVRAVPEELSHSELGEARWVDYWSLDVEGAELRILRATNFTDVRFGVMTVEVNGEEDAICRLMARNGFSFADLPGEPIFFDPNYFRWRGIRPPFSKECQGATRGGLRRREARGDGGKGGGDGARRLRRNPR
jgi:hypothetical protein